MISLFYPHRGKAVEFSWETKYATCSRWYWQAALVLPSAAQWQFSALCFMWILKRKLSYTLLSQCGPSADTVWRGNVALKAKESRFFALMGDSAPPPSHDT